MKSRETSLSHDDTQTPRQIHVTPRDHTRLPRSVFAKLGPCLAGLGLLASASAEPIYRSSFLSGYTVSAEPLAGSDYRPGDVDLVRYPLSIEVRSNVQRRHTYVNAIGNIGFVELFPDRSPVRLGAYEYVVDVRLPVLPRPDPSQPYAPQAVHVMIALFDGRNLLWPANKRTLEATIYWDLNPWTPDGAAGKLKVYSGTSLTPQDTGVSLMPDTAWHTFRVACDLASGEYLSISVDNQLVELPGVPLATRDHSRDEGWKDDNRVKLSLTAESLAAFPSGPSDAFTWGTQFRDAMLAPAREPVMLLLPPAVEFGKVVVGKSAVHDLFVRNEGTGLLTGHVELSTDSGFEVLGDPSYSLPARQGKVVRLRFRPEHEGTYSGTASFTGAGENRRTLTGVGYVPPKAVISPGGLDFGIVRVGASAVKTFTIENGGGGILNGRLEAVPTGAFSVVGDPNFSLSTRQKSTLSVSFNPVSPGFYGGTATFKGADTSRPLIGRARLP